MLYQRHPRLPLLTAIFILLLAACSGTSDRPGDAEPLPADVPAEATAAPAPTEPPEPAPSPTTPTDEPASSAPESQAATATPQDVAVAGPVLTFKISGGVVGFCDELTLDPDGVFTLVTCNQSEPITGTLEPPDQESLQAWHENLTSFHRTFEDNPQGEDNLLTDLIFNGSGEVEADSRQQQVIFDWASGLTTRLRFKPEPTATPAELVSSEPNALCPNIPRPALITLDFEDPTTLVVIEPETQASCNFTLEPPPLGRIVSVAGSLYYAVFDADSQTTTVWQHNPDGQQFPLEFTGVAMAEEPTPYDFILSDDGTKIAWLWSEVDLETDPPLYRNNLRLANTDGSNPAAVLDNAENSDERFVALGRFSVDNSTFFYALQPDIGGPIFTGRYDTLYSIDTNGGQPQLLYSCPAENPVCLGGISPDGQLLTLVQPQEGTIQLLNQAGGVINTLTLPATDYVERTAFAPNGNMAFISAALLQAEQGEPTLPNPGYISFLPPPYSGESQILYSDNSVGTLRGWLDNDRLIFGSIDRDGNTSTAIVTTGGQVTNLTENVAVGILR